MEDFDIPPARTQSWLRLFTAALAASLASAALATSATVYILHPSRSAEPSPAAENAWRHQLEAAREIRRLTSQPPTESTVR